MEALAKLFEETGLPQADLPAPLADLYGGGLGFATSVMYANFVSSLDGVVVLTEAGISSGPAISGRNEADRFVMGLLRTFADAVLIGAGTLRADHGHLWTPDYIYPRMGAEFAELRRRLGRGGAPRLVVVTARGEIAVDEPALELGALVITGSAGAARLRGRLPATTSLVELAEPIQAAGIAGVLRSEGHLSVLTEGGPTLIGQLVEAGLVDELFLTLSPLLAGRQGPGRLGLVEGVQLLPGRQLWSRLLSLRTHGSHLFLRYGLQEMRSGAE